MWIFIRAVNKDILEKAVERIVNIGKGASLMTSAGFRFKRAQNTFYDIKHNKELDSAISYCFMDFHTWSKLLSHCINSSHNKMAGIKCINSHIRIWGLKLHSGQSMEMVKAGQLHFLQNMMHFLDMGRTYYLCYDMITFN